MNEIIKPCPHCGHEARISEKHSYKSRADFVFVKCTFCGATGKTYSTSEGHGDDWYNDACALAADAWNMRWPADEPSNQ